MLLNSVMNFALENKIKKFYSSTSDLAIANTDASRRATLGRELFDKVYDRAILQQFQVKKSADWWVIDVEKNKNKIVLPEKKQDIIEYDKTICLCHDIERGFGYIDTDPEFARFADKYAVGALDEMLSIERTMGVKATYNVLGCLFGEIREKIEKDGHCIAFHSYDHKIDTEQLRRCRRVDYRIKGFRLPRSKITPEISDQNLCYQNFEWLASSAFSLKIMFPMIQNRIVKIHILFDDFDMYKNKTKYAEWKDKAIDKIKENYFVAFCLHDCYAQYWLPHYRVFIEKIKELGTVKTLNEVANEIILESAL
jgi:hypothetical protein